MNYDTWKTTEPQPVEPDEPVAYDCLDCPWRGRGGRAAYEHHRAHAQHHRVAVRHGPVARFSCCDGRER